MPSELLAMLIPEDSPGAGLLMRRADGRFAFGQIDVRVARAARAAGLRRALRALEHEEAERTPGARPETHRDQAGLTSSRSGASLDPGRVDGMKGRSFSAG